jgi:signal transduction histidine kinase/ActR/RegA family two-component response regulator
MESQEHTPLPRERDPDEIERIAHVGSWTLDPASGEATWSAEMYRILGLDPGGPPLGLADLPWSFTADSVERVTAAVERAVTAGESWQLELEVVRPDGSRRWVESKGLAERDGSETVRRIRGTMQDVTEHRRLQAQLDQAQRLEAVGQLAGGIAHDFNNVLTAIRGYTQLVRDDLGQDDPRAADLDHVLSSADRAADLVAQLLAFSRRQVLKPAVLDPALVVHEVLPMLTRLLGEGIEVVTVAEPGLGRILVDPGQLGQVIVNLGVNARDAMPRGGRLTIEAMNVELDTAYTAAHPGASAGPHVLIAVSDTGHGMDAAIQAKAFDPFFTTKGPDRGTGMGLATVYGIVTQSGGSIYLYSEPGRGTTFKLYFPRTDAPMTERADANALPAARLTGSETILLVEDDADVRHFAARVLAGAGFTVHEASSGSDAVELARITGHIDLLLTDADLPGVHGREVADRLTEAQPGLPVLFVSGFTEHSIIQHGVVAPDIRFLPKPFRAEDLLRNVREILDEAGVPG